jgi:hypothetical protein
LTMRDEDLGWAGSKISDWQSSAHGSDVIDSISEVVGYPITREEFLQNYSSEERQELRLRARMCSNCGKIKSRTTGRLCLDCWQLDICRICWRKHPSRQYKEHCPVCGRACRGLICRLCYSVKSQESLSTVAFSLKNQ